MSLYTNLQYGVINNAAASGQTALVAAPANGQAIYVVSYVVVAAGAVTVKFQSGNTDITGTMSLAANGGLVCAGRPESPVLKCGANAALNINAGGAVQLSGHFSYVLF